MHIQLSFGQQYRGGGRVKFLCSFSMAAASILGLQGIFFVGSKTRNGSEVNRVSQLWHQNKYPQWHTAISRIFLKATNRPPSWNDFGDWLCIRASAPLRCPAHPDL